MARADDREKSEGLDRRSHDDSGARTSIKVVMISSMAILVIAVLWLVYSANQPRIVSRVYKAGRLLTVERPFPSEGRFAGDPYVGPKVCAECHPAEAALHSRSGHSSTLLPASRRALSRRLDGTTAADTEKPGVFWSYRYRDGQLHIARRAPNKVEECIAEYAFGSGHHATTFVSVIDAEMPAILEHRLTYFTQEGTLALTPGHDLKPPPATLTPNGHLPPPDVTRKCFECHTTQLVAHGEQRIDEETMIPNVSCERCHGPGRAHVAAAREKAPGSQLSLPFGPGRWTSAELLRFCGECHRHPDGPRPAEIRLGDPMLARFQPIGLMRSKCYLRSEGKLDCITCHDPHARTSSNRVEYDKICLSCHSAGERSSNLPPARRPRAVVCSISPGDRCVECHMPRVAVDSGRHIRFSDHWVRPH
jgi:predicted CXXCH cytochrome family protein